MNRKLDNLSLHEQLEIYERNARFCGRGGLAEHCRRRAEQIRFQLREQIDYYEVITDAALKS